MESLVPNVFVHNMNMTMAFYTMLGFNVTMSVPEKSPYDWVMMTNGNVVIMFQTFASLGTEIPEIKRTNGGSLLLYIKVKEIRSLFDKVKEKATVVKELNKTFYGATEFSIKDCNDYILTFAEDEK